MIKRTTVSVRKLPHDLRNIAGLLRQVPHQLRKVPDIFRNIAEGLRKLPDEFRNITENFRKQPHIRTYLHGFCTKVVTSIDQQNYNIYLKKQKIK